MAEAEVQSVPQANRESTAVIVPKSDSQFAGAGAFFEAAL
jgi:hypothetical protein